MRAALLHVDAAVFDFFHNLVVAIGKHLPDKYPAEVLAELLGDRLRSILLVDELFDGQAFFVFGHVLAGDVSRSGKFP